MDSASIVAVVVPSPAMSLVLEATSLTIWAPMFSYGSFNSISLATVTPSLVTVGAPNFLSSTTLRPFGPSVTFTALARVSTPFSMERRASSLNFNCFATVQLLVLYDHNMRYIWSRRISPFSTTVQCPEYPLPAS